MDTLSSYHIYPGEDGRKLKNYADLDAAPTTKTVFTVDKIDINLVFLQAIDYGFEGLLED